MDVKPFGGCSKEEGLVRGTNRYVFGQRLYEGISTKDRGVAIFGRQNVPAAAAPLLSLQAKGAIKIQGTLQHSIIIEI